MNKQDITRILEEFEIELDNENEQYKLLRKNSIKTSEGIEDEWVASIYDLDSFNAFLETVSTQVRKEEREKWETQLKEIVTNPQFEDEDYHEEILKLLTPQVKEECHDERITCQGLCHCGKRICCQPEGGRK